MNLLVKILVMIGSSASIGFGVWHFFVPKAWKWYSYIDANATELAAAVRAINAFFSLSLVLFGIVTDGASFYETFLPLGLQIQGKCALEFPL